MQAKKDREDEDARKLAQRNKEVSEVLKEQMQVLERQKEEEKRLRVENARLLVLFEHFNLVQISYLLIFCRKRCETSRS